MQGSNGNNPAIPSWFDAKFFAQSYMQDQPEASPTDAYRTFLERKQDSDVFPSAAQYIEAHAADFPSHLRPYADRIVRSFDWQGYASCNQDLATLEPIHLVRHFLAYGLTEPRHWNPKASLLDRRFAWAAQTGRHEHLDNHFQAVVHCYHFDVLCSLIPYLRNVARLGGSVHILVANNSISSHVMDGFITGLRSGVHRHSWQRVLNWGEDWSSFDYACRDGLFDHEGVTIKMQTKKSKNLGADGGPAWIDEALAPICGTYWAIEQTLASLRSGHFMLHASALTKRTGFGANEELVSSCMSRLGLNSEADAKLLPFSGGSMFATRNHLIKEFFGALGTVTYAETFSDSPYCGRYLGHALERAFFYFSHSRYGPKSTNWTL